MKTTVSKIIEDFKESGLILRMLGQDVEIRGIVPVEEAGPGTLVFVDRPDFLPLVQKGRPSVIVAPEKMEAPLSDLKSDATVLIVSNVSLAHALFRQKYADRDLRNTEWPRIHPSAIIHGSVVHSDDCIVGPGVVIGRNCVIGKGTILMANSVVEENVHIGESCVIHPNVTIGYDTRIGNHVIIKSGSVIGSEGFGFAQDAKRHSHRIPQTGRVVLEDSVVIGANNCIDRATYRETRIMKGTKLDNLCHVAHNVTIGEDCLLTAGFIVAGSTKIGNRTIASGQVGVLDHLELADDVVLLHRAGVTDNITEPGAYAGLPLQPLDQYLKNGAVAKKLTDLRKRLQSLESRLSELEKRDATD